MSYTLRELKDRPPSHPRVRRLLLILGIILFILLIFFSFTSVQNDAAFVTHFVNPPPHLTYHGQSDYVTGVSWSPDGRWIASSSGDDTVRIWNATTGATQHVYRLAQAAFCVAWSPDGQEIAAGSLDHHVYIWNVASGKLLLTYTGHSDAVFSIAWSPDGTHMASASGDGSVQVWSTTTGRMFYRYGTLPIKGAPAPWNSVAWSPDGRYLALGGNGNAIVLNAATGQEFGSYGYNGGTIHAIVWSPDSTAIAFGGADASVQVWKIANHQNVYTYEGHTTDVFSVAWSPNGKRIASGDAVGLVEVWDAYSGAHVYTYRGHADIYPNHFTAGSNAAVNALAWSPDSRRIASGSSDDTVQVWKAE